MPYPGGKVQRGTCCLMSLTTSPSERPWVLARDADLPHQVEPADVGGRRARVDGGHLGERHQGPSELPGQIQFQQVAAAGPLRTLDAQPHIVAVAVGVLELRDDLAGDQTAHGRRHGSQVEAQVARLLPVQADPQLRPRVFLAGVHIRGAGHVFARCSAGEPRRRAAALRSSPRRLIWIGASAPPIDSSPTAVRRAGYRFRRCRRSAMIAR